MDCFQSFDQISSCLQTLKQAWDFRMNLVQSVLQSLLSVLSRFQNLVNLFSCHQSPVRKPQFQPVAQTRWNGSVHHVAVMRPILRLVSRQWNVLAVEDICIVMSDVANFASPRIQATFGGSYDPVRIVNHASTSPGFFMWFQGAVLNFCEVTVTENEVVSAGLCIA